MMKKCVSLFLLLFFCGCRLTTLAEQFSLKTGLKIEVQIVGEDSCASNQLIQWGQEFAQQEQVVQNDLKTIFSSYQKIIFHGTEIALERAKTFVKIDQNIEVTNFKFLTENKSEQCTRPLGLIELASLINSKLIGVTTPQNIPSKIIVTASLNNIFPMGFNGVMYNFLVDQSFTQISQAAKTKGLSFQVNRRALVNDYIHFYHDPYVERLIILAHGSRWNQTGAFYDAGEAPSFQSNISFSEHYNVKKGERLSLIDIVACDQLEMAQEWSKAFGVETRTYSQAYDKNHQDGVIFWNQTNAVLNQVIPQSILTGVNNSGVPPIAPEPFTLWFTTNFY